MRTLDEVCELLGLSGKEVERVKNYLLFDLTFLLDFDTGVPPGWVPQVGLWDWPVPGVYTVTSGFGTRVDPVNGDSRFHAGVDIAGEEGTRVVAARKGVVARAGWSGGYGNLVVLDHGDGVETYYAHLSAITVSRGQVVEKGQEVGRMGSTGKSTGPHLHFQVNVNGTPVDPLKFYGGG